MIAQVFCAFGAALCVWAGLTALGVQEQPALLLALAVLAGLIAIMPDGRR